MEATKTIFTKDLAGGVRQVNIRACIVPQSPVEQKFLHKYMAIPVAPYEVIERDGPRSIPFPKDLDQLTTAERWAEYMGEVAVIEGWFASFLFTDDPRIQRIIDLTLAAGNHIVAGNRRYHIESFTVDLKGQHIEVVAHLHRSPEWKP